MKRVLLVGVLFIAVSGLASSVWYLSQSESPLFKPVQNYKIVSPLKKVGVAEIDAVMQKYLGMSFWEVKLDEIQAELTRLDWVSHSSVKRNWPDRLYITIEEQKPVARWGEAGLVNQSGEVFYPQDVGQFQNLVLLDGPLEYSGELLLNLKDLQKRLKKLNFTIASLKRQMDGIWRIQILNGPEIILDGVNWVDKLDRFILAYPQLSEGFRKSAQVYDLRYSNGFIVGNPS